MSYCYLNGDIKPFDECSLHISDLQFQRSYGVFDYFRCRNNEIPWLGDYTGRLFNSIHLAGIEIDMSREEFTNIVYDLKHRNGSDQMAFKVIVTGGYSDTLESVTGSANILILNVPWRQPAKESFEKGVNLISCEYQRPDPEIKSLYYFNTLKLRKRLKEFNAIDVLYYTNNITEASRASVFFVKGSDVFTPTNNILSGITRKKLLSVYPEIKQRDIEASRLFDFDEMFVASTSRDLTPVVRVDGKKIGDGKVGKVTREIMNNFQRQEWK
jgi:branched-chain amino acid aminotransferase